MAKKDFDFTENADKSNSIDSSGKKDATMQSEKKEEDKSSDAIKNAHATGDGSFGRNDSSLPEDETEENTNGASY